MNGYEAVKAAIHVAGISSTEKLVLIALADHVNEAGECWPSLVRLMDLTGFSRQGVVNAVHRLEQHGLIRRVKRSGRATVYDLSELSNQSTTLTSDEPTSQRGVPVPVNDVDWTSQRGVPEQNSNKPSEQTKEAEAVVDIGAVYTAYQSEIGMMSKLISDSIADAVAEFGAQPVIDAVHIAAKNNVRKWTYIDGVLKRWRANGHGPVAAEPHIFEVGNR